jgi:hypothetical protein
MAHQSLELRRQGDLWVVRVTDTSERTFEYHYAFESQARYFAAVFELGPRKLPEPQRAVPRRTRSRRPRTVGAKAPLVSAGPLEPR